MKNPDPSVGRLSPPESQSMSAEDKRLDMSSDWLIGDDMTTELVRSLDWSATPIGPREQWPPELKTITNLIMSNPLPSAILWGNDLIFIYNQEYSIIAGDRHPGAMGRCTREVWPDVWDFNKPIFERVLQHGEAVFFENQPYRISRRGKFEDAFFTISYSPIRMSNGKIGGSLCTLIETTERKRANEALRESEVRYRQLVQNTTAIILRLDLQGRITFINDYAQKFFGYSADEIIGQKALGAIIPEKETSGRDLAAMVDDIIANPDRFYTNSNENIKKTGERVWVEWTNSGIYNDEGLLCGFLAVGIDRTESKKIEEALRQARLRSEWLARFPEENPNPIMRVSAKGEILYSNPVSQKSAEWKYETGQSVPDWLFQMIKQATKKGWTVTQDLEIGQRAYSVTIAPFPAEGYVNVYGRDITESKQAEAKLHSDLNALTKMQRLSGTLLAKEGIYPLLQKIMDTAVEIMGAERGTLQLLEGDSLKIAAHHGHKEPFLNYFASAEDRASVCREVLTSGMRVVVPDVNQSSILWGNPSLAILQQAGVRSVQSTPLLSRTGRLLGILTTQWGEPHSPDQDDLGRIDLLARQAADLIEISLVQEELKNYQNELEDRVKARTSELVQSNKSLLTEIEERKRIERRLQSARNKLRAMAAEIVIADERSRQHFAIDLHDTVVQTMGAAKLRSQLIQDKIPEDVKPLFSELQEFLSQSITQARMIMAEMSPPVLYELGFIPALEWLTEQVSYQHNLPVAFKADGKPMLLHEIQVLMFQATRELLMNIVKHSGAKKGVVTVSVSGSEIRVKVKDDGRGFNKQDVFQTDVSGGGFGLFSIRERLRHFNGNLSIRSKPGQGAIVTMTVPRITDTDND